MHTLTDALEAYRYQGRHRAPPDHAAARRGATVALLVAAGSSVLTMPASAGPNWDPLLDCESDWRNVESYNASSASATSRSSTTPGPSSAGSRSRPARSTPPARSRK
jgi:hypothetical protein